jgi:hypothetical protein
MPIALHSYKIDKDGEITVRHTFYAATEEEAEELMETHAEGCAAYGPALDTGDTIEILEENVSAPDVEELERVADLQDDGDDEPEEEDDDAEDEEETEER